MKGPVINGRSARPARPASPSRPSRSLGAAAAAVLAGLGLLGAARPALAGGLPDWAVPIVEHAPALPEGVVTYNYRILFTETRMAVASDGGRYTRQRIVEQILSPTDKIHVGGFSFGGSAKMKTSKAWHIVPGEKARATNLPPIDVSSQESFLSDSKTRLVAVSGSRPGSLVVFEYEVTDTVPALGWCYDFYEGVPVAVSRYEIAAPTGWTVQSGWLRRDPLAPTDNGEAKTWELRDLKPAQEESLGESPVDVSPLLVVNLAPPKGAPAAANAIPDWPAMAVWYDRLAQGRAAVTPEIQAASRKALGAAPESAGFFEKVRAESGFVRDAVRYLDVELGTGALQPRAAADTLTNLYGDCKDKATLLVAILASQGIRAYPVLVHATRQATVHATIPAANAFNHAITAVPVPDAAPVPDWAAGSIVDAGDLGRLLIVDTTREVTSIGSLPSYLAGKQALVLAGPKGRLITLPMGGAAAHRVERSVATEVHADRSLDVTMTARFFGEPAAILRTLERRSEPDLRKIAERRGLDAWVEAQPKDFSIQQETPDGLAVERVKWTVPALPTSGPEASIPLFPGAAGELPHLSLSQRNTLVDLGFPQTLRYENTVQGYPADTGLPHPQAMKGDAWSVTTTYVREGTTLKAVWEMKLTRSRFTPEALPDLKKLYAAIRSTGGVSVALP